MKSTKVRRRPLRTGDLCSETALHRSARLRSFSELPFTSANTLGCVPTVETRPAIGRQTLFAAPAVFARPYHFRTRLGKRTWRRKVPALSSQPYDSVYRTYYSSLPRLGKRTQRRKLAVP